ncbi:MAG: non-canonical purine NTP pyrophosphatase, partial [Candidatus Limnocylindria bacterium]
MTDLLLATTNPGKQREFLRLLSGLPGRVLVPQQIGLDLDVPEPHLSYAENASAKADAYCRASGLPTLADDSGLEVAALDWGPGVRTGRYGGPGVADRVGYLLERLDGATDRRARMVCWLALAT